MLAASGCVSGLHAGVHLVAHPRSPDVMGVLSLPSVEGSMVRSPYLVT